MTRMLVRLAIVAAVSVAWAMPAAARPRHRSQPPATAPTEAARPVFEFYPREIEGGVSGNLPFNNQIRKFKDPLNANGAGG